MSGNTFLTARETQLFGGCRLHIDSLGKTGQVGSKVVTDGTDMGGHFRRLEDKCSVQICQHPAAIMHPLHHLTQKNATINASVSVVGIGKMSADIALTNRTQQGVANRMNQHITIRVSQQSAVMSNSDPAKHQGTSATKAVYIVTVSYTHGNATP